MFLDSSLTSLSVSPNPPSYVLTVTHLSSLTLFPSEFCSSDLTEFPTSKLLTIGSLPLYASLVSFNSLAAKYPGKTVKHESHEVALQRFKEKGDFLSWLKVEWDSGRGGSDGAGNKLWPEWNPKGVETFL